MFSALLCRAQNITVHGEVVSAADNEPLIGVSVNADATGVATATDFDGQFEITVPQGTILTFSYVGYKAQSLKAQNEMKVSLSEDSELLDEVVVVGYSVQRKVDVTGAITAVDVNEIAKQNENNHQGSAGPCAGHEHLG